MVVANPLTVLWNGDKLREVDARGLVRDADLDVWVEVEARTGADCLGIAVAMERAENAGEALGVVRTLAEMFDRICRRDAKGKIVRMDRGNTGRRIARDMASIHPGEEADLPCIHPVSSGAVAEVWRNA